MTADNSTAYGRRLLPAVLDQLADTNPSRIYAAIPKTSDVKDGYRDISVADLARCVNFMAWWIEDKFGRSESFETITFIGLSDLRGPALFMAAVKTGYKLLLPNPRNPPATNLSLMNQTGSTKVLYSEELASQIGPLLAVAPSFSTNAVPDFQTMLESHPELYPYLKSFSEARNDPVVVLHSSGSTGLPKPITLTHGSWAAHDNDHNLPVPPGREKMDSTVFNLDGEARVYVMRPFFSLGGCLFFMHHSIFNTITVVIGPPEIFPDATLLKAIARQQKLRGIIVIPAMLEQLLQDAEGIDLIKNLEFVTCAGAALPDDIGDKVSGMVKLFHFIGSTETFPLPELLTPPSDWAYHEFHPNLKHEMRLYDSSKNTHELIILAGEDVKDMTPLYHNIPGVTSFDTKDLYMRHPQKPTYFKYYGRRDDIVVLALGEKVNPIPLEQHVQKHPSVNEAVLIGRGRVQSALLIEPQEPQKFKDATSRSAFLEMIWPQVEEANAYVSGLGRVARDKIICTQPDKPFVRTGKGNVIRKQTEEAYKDEIESLY